MKRFAIFVFIVLGLSFISCNKVDLSGVESRLSRLESEYSQLSSAVNALQQAKNDGDYITAVTPVVEKNIVVGYTIKFRKADPITIYNGKDGKDGEDGKDGGMPNVTISYTDTSIVFTFSDKTVIEIPFSSSDFIKSIISVTFVPEFYDGLPTMYYGKDSKHASLRYVVSPSSVAGTLTKDKVKVNAVYTQTRASIDNISLAVTAFSADAATGVVDLTIDGSVLSNDYYSGKVFASISLQISDGTAAYNTDYLRIVAKNEGSGPDTPEPPTPSSVLSDGGKANCYMAPAGKSYSFYAMTKGNSSESVGTPTKAELLWETQCGADALEKNYVVKDVVFDSGYVYFTAVADGNAVIAVKDAGGNILWSWHIWVTDYNPNNEYDTYINGNIMMNRNIGALSNRPSDKSLTYGMLYQWGRKDPFVSTNDESSATFASTFPPFVSTSIDKDDETGTVKYTVANPTVFIKSPDGEGWQYSKNNKLWASAKTMYDPCPAGWKVPDANVWTGWPDAYLQSGPALKNNTYSGFIFPTDYSYPETWYPMMGMKDHKSSMALVILTDGSSFGFKGTVIGLWANDYANYYLGAYENHYGYNYIFSMGAPYSYSLDAGDALTVRCQKEK